MRPLSMGALAYAFNGAPAEHPPLRTELIPSRSAACVLPDPTAAEAGSQAPRIPTTSQPSSTGAGPVEATCLDGGDGGFLCFSFLSLAFSLTLSFCLSIGLSDSTSPLSPL